MGGVGIRNKEREGGVAEREGRGAGRGKYELNKKGGGYRRRGGREWRGAARERSKRRGENAGGRGGET